MTHEQTPGYNPAQNETNKQQISQEAYFGKGLETATRLSAIGLLGISALAGGVAVYENSQAESFRKGAVIQEQQGIPHGAEYANEYAYKKEQARNQLLGATAFTLAAGLGGLTMAARNKRIREVIISGEKPTEQPKE